jgi:hypothetical protein
MNAFPFQQDYTWRKLGFLLYYNSVNYRQVLEENPQWSVIDLPPIGAQMRSDAGTQARSGLSQASFIYTTGTESSDDGFFPYGSREEYIKSLVRYTPSAINQLTKINGYTADTEEAQTGNTGKIN